MNNTTLHEDIRVLPNAWRIPLPVFKYLGIYRAKFCSKLAIIVTLGTALPLVMAAQWTNGTGGTIYYNAGKVGIGTSAPGYTLDLTTTSANDGLRMTNSAAGGPFLWLNATNSANANRFTGVVLQNSGTNQWEMALRAGDGLLHFYDMVNSVDRLVISASGRVGIGTTNPAYPLSVNGVIQAKEVLVNTGWSDYVFDPGYKLPTFEEVASYIKQNHHLSGIPSESEIKEKGVSVGEVESKLLAKVEELTLQMLQLHEQNKQLRQELDQLKAR